jgi:hypothetical protein
MELFSYASFLITVGASAFSFINSDRTKKIMGFLVAFLGAIFTLINSIQTQKTDRVSKHQSDSIEIVNSKLQLKINNKADTIVYNQKIQYAEFSKAAKTTLKNLNKVTDSLKGIFSVEKETLSNVKGTSKHPLFEFLIAPFSQTKNQVIIKVYNLDKYPIHKLHINFFFTYSNIVEITSQDNNGEAEFKRKEGADLSKTIVLDDLLGSEPQEVLHDYFPINLNVLAYDFSVRWGNNTYTGFLTFKRNGKSYKLDQMYILNGKKNNPKEYFKIINVLAKS